MVFQFQNGLVILKINIFFYSFFLGDILMWFKKKLRPLLNPKKKIKGMWINNEGYCLGKYFFFSFLFI